MINWYGKIIGINVIKSKGVPTSKANVLLSINTVEQDGKPCEAVTDKDEESTTNYEDKIFEIIGVVENNYIVLGDIKVRIEKAINTHLSFRTLTEGSYTKLTKAGYVRRTAPNGRIMHYFNGQAALTSWAIEVEPTWTVPVVAAAVAA